MSQLIRLPNFIIIEFAQKTHKNRAKMIHLHTTPFEIPNQESITLYPESLENSRRFNGFASTQHSKSMDDCLIRLPKQESSSISDCSLNKMKSQNNLFLSNKVDFDDSPDEAFRKQIQFLNLKKSKSITNSIYSQEYSPSIRESLSIISETNDKNMGQVPINQCESCLKCLKWAEFAKSQKLTMLQLQKALIEKQQALQGVFKELTFKLETKLKQNQNFQIMLQQLKSQNSKTVALLKQYKHELQISTRKAKQGHYQRKHAVNANKDKSQQNQSQLKQAKRVNLSISKTDNIWQKKILAASTLWQNSDISRIHKPDQTTYEFNCTEYVSQNQNQVNQKNNQKSTPYNNLFNLQGSKNNQLNKLNQLKSTIKKLEFENKNLKSYNEVLAQNLQSKKNRKFF